MSVPDIVFEILMSGSPVSGCTPVAWHEERQALEVEPLFGPNVMKRVVDSSVPAATIFVPLSFMEAFVASEPWACAPGAVRDGTLSRLGALSTNPNALLLTRTSNIVGWAVAERTITGRLAWSSDCTLELSACTLRRLCDLRPDDKGVAPVREFVDTAFAYLSGDANLHDLLEAEGGVVWPRSIRVDAFARHVLECCEFAVASPSNLSSVLAVATTRHGIEMRSGGHKGKTAARQAETAAQCVDFMRIASRYADEVIANGEPPPSAPRPF